MERKLREPDTFNYIYNWFNNELKTVFDIDVFEKPFPVKTGYEFYTKNNIQVLLIRLEDLTDTGATAISEFLNLDGPLLLKKGNIRAENQESEAYEDVLKNLRVEPALCIEIYNSRFVRQFYDEDYIRKFISKWTSSCVG